MSRLHVLASPVHRLVRAPPRSEAEAAVREARIEDGVQDLEQGLLDQSVYHRRDAQQPDPLACWLGDLHPQHRLRLVAAVEQLLPDSRPVCAIRPS